ncbi:glutamate synthase (NADPH), homotetrameric [Oceanidesulfovibrio marinus]|uniref:Glutamate synthase (NADPH), homotetrameric n=2 Tax=Oceanidesulfovibrio marinus TaxID=370038 RepID=A0A6P1ZG83_9BACT|nr:glutamate synthase (NADPH), homotetrameric [Oceanidesulfovibrio marinus]
MPNTILEKEQLIPDQTSKLVIDAPEIAAKARPGNFVILRVDPRGERIPLTIADADKEKGTITIVYLVLGKTTAMLEDLQVGDAILDLCGPLGKATDIEQEGTVVCVGGGTGIAAMHHIAKGHHEAGNKVVAIIGARTKDLLLFEDELMRFADEVLVSTDDGSYGHKGLVTELLEDRLQSDKSVFEVVAVGPVPMMAAVSKVTEKYDVKTTVSLNSIMVDGIGMCGACRVTVGGETKFACVDGPEFDGHKVDFVELGNRLRYFKSLECVSYDDFKECKCAEKEGKKKKAKKPAQPRVPMPHQPPEQRITNFDEVALGYSMDMAVTEAARCLQCKKPQCVKGCPVEVNIPDFIAALVQRDVEKAYKVIKGTNSLPAVCGRVCPQESQCEGSCILGVKAEPVAIGRLERFVADEFFHRDACDLISDKPECPLIDEEKKVACIGSGPSSLTVAGYMASRGCKVTVFEALHELGGVLVYGIPEFRLPKSKIVGKEVNALNDLQVEFKTNAVAGKTFSLQELFDQGYKSVFIGVGAGLPKFLNIPGENLSGVFSANEYLTRINLGRAYSFPDFDTPIVRGKKVTVYGGGNVAMDAARTAVRLGAESVHIVYRRTQDAMPARKEEVDHAVEEGVIMECLASPLEFKPGEDGNLGSVRLQRMELGEPDDSGRRRPVTIEGDIYELPTDLAVIAVGTRSNPVLLESEPDLKLNKWGYIEVDEETGETSMPNVFAGGDIVTGAATVILAMGAGRTAAKEMAKRLGCE